MGTDGRRHAGAGLGRVPPKYVRQGNGATHAPARGIDASRRGCFLADAPRQARTADAWKRFADDLAQALRGLEEDEWLVVSLKHRSRFVQFMNQGHAGMRAEAVSDFYLPQNEQLSERDREMLLELGWDAPTVLPDEFGHSSDGSPNYFLDLANPVPLDELALLAINTLMHVHGARHPGSLEYSTGSQAHASIRFPGLGIRRARSN